MLLPTLLSIYTTAVLVGGSNPVGAVSSHNKPITSSITASITVTAVPTAATASGGLARSLDSVPPPVLTDSLLLGWHLARIHMYDTLLVHPELEKVAGVAQMLHGGDCKPWAGPSSSDTAAVIKQGGLPGFPVDQIVQVISKTPALAGAVKSALLTPSEFAATTSAIEQEGCASAALYSAFDSTGHWPVDSNSTLGKNLVYFWFWTSGEERRFEKIAARKDYVGTEAIKAGRELDEITKRLSKEREFYGKRQDRIKHFMEIQVQAKSENKKRVEDLIEMDQWLDYTGREIPIKHDSIKFDQ